MQKPEEPYLFNLENCFLERFRKPADKYLKVSIMRLISSQSDWSTGWPGLPNPSILIPVIANFEYGLEGMDCQIKYER